MRPTSLFFCVGVGVCVAAGCAGEPTPPPSSPGDAPAPPAHGYQVSFGPFDVKAGGEVQLCRTLKLPNDVPVAVDRLEVLMREGSHHFILFRSKLDVPDQVFPCFNTVNFEEWDFLLDVNRTGGYDWQLEKGQAFIMQPHQQIMVQSHYVNAKTVTTPNGGQAYLNMHSIPMAQVEHEIKGMFTVNTRIRIPPYSLYTTSKKCTLSRSVNMVAMTGHFHARGTEFSVNQLVLSGDDNLPDQDMGRIYHSLSWDAPVFQTWPVPIYLHGAGFHGLQFACSFDNTTGPTAAGPISFGGRADVQEHCNLFFQYYDETPTQEALSCLEGSGGW